MSKHQMPCEICAEELEDDYGVWLCGKLCCKACIEALFDLVFQQRRKEIVFGAPPLGRPTRDTL